MPFALNQAEDSQVCSAGSVRQSLRLEGWELSGRNEIRRSQRLSRPKPSVGPAWVTWKVKVAFISALPYFCSSPEELIQTV